MIEDAELEQRFLDFVFTTEATITAGAVAYFCKVPVQHAERLLDRLTVDGTLRIENTDSGDIFYVYPNRSRLDRPKALSGSRPAVAAPGTSIVIGHRPGVPVPLPVAGPLVEGGATTCPFCGEAILPVAKKCKHCGEMLDPTLRAAQSSPIHVNVGMQPVRPGEVPYNPHARHISPGVAAVLSFVWPGAGQMYTGHIGAGLGWMVGTFLGYVALIVPGLILHALCIFSAANAAKNENRRTGAL